MGLHLVQKQSACNVQIVFQQDPPEYLEISVLLINKHSHL